MADWNLNLADQEQSGNLIISELRAALGRVQNPHAAMPAILAALDDLLGINGTSIEWGYLNSGTHDAQQNHEFDRAAVRRIVNAATALDTGLQLLQQRH